MPSWPEFVGDVVDLGDGCKVRGRSMRRPPAADEIPDLGIYLRGRRPPVSPWAAIWVPWPDYALPLNPVRFRRVLVDALDRCTDERIEFGCAGGRGRTGTALACLATLTGMSGDEAISFIRNAYHPRAVETPWQRWFVRSFAGHQR